MSFAYLPLYTGDYVRDTQHLSCSEHGIYLKLLMHCWDQKGPAPLDERKLCGIVNARSSDEIEALRRVVCEFFVAMQDGFYNKRIQSEIERCAAISTARADAGRRGANQRMRAFRERQASAKQVLSNCSASAKQVTLSPSPSPEPIQPLNSVLPVASQPTALVAQASPRRRDACPYAAIVNAYHRHLPMLPAVEVLSDARKRAIAARWREVLHDHKDELDPAAASLEWFDWFFQTVTKSKFLTGKVKDWRADFNFLMTPEKFVRIVEGFYTKETA